MEMNLVTFVTGIVFIVIFISVLSCYIRFTNVEEKILDILLIFVFLTGCAGFLTWLSMRGTLCAYLTAFVVLGVIIWYSIFFDIELLLGRQNLTKKDINNRITGQISSLLKKDANFSRPVFLDYAQMLFLKTYYSFTDTRKIKEIEPYFEYDIKKFRRTVYSKVVVEHAEITNIGTSNGKFNVSVNFSAYFAAKYKQKTFHCKAEEEWKFSRKDSAVSSVPNGFGVIRCPKCGKILGFEDYGHCPRCGTVQSFESGQWVVSEVVRFKAEQFFPEETLKLYPPERKEPLPSVVSVSIKRKEHEFFKIQNFKFMNFKDFENRIAKPYFLKIYRDFSLGQWNKTRHLVYENLWQNINFKLSQLKDLGYKRITDSIEVKKTETVNYEKDNFYQMMTVRISAECFDYVINYEDGIIGGSNREKRSFSQYWKFLSCIGFSGKISGPEVCPVCGKDVEDVDNSGLCPYCMNRVNDGNFSWVVYSITDENDYAG